MLRKSVWRTVGSKKEMQWIRMLKNTIDKAKMPKSLLPGRDPFRFIELRLTSYLRTIGVHEAAVGVSNDCCQLCAVTAGGYNSAGVNFVTSESHGELYRAMLPPEKDARKAVRREINLLLVQELRSLRLCSVFLEPQIKQMIVRDKHNNTLHYKV